MFKESPLSGLGITVGGKWKLLDVSLGDRESSAYWKAFYEELKLWVFKGKAFLLGEHERASGREAATKEAFPQYTMGI